jgi:hypothetical protein
VAFVRLAYLSFILVAAGCPHKKSELVDAPLAHARSQVADAMIAAPSGLDLLFVVDNSGSMNEEQVALAGTFPRMLASITAAAGVLPDLHVGVISTNMGTGGVPIFGCNGSGDDGALLTGPPGATCTALDAGARFVSDVAGAGGARVKNYTGSLDGVFGCMAKLGTTGCGLEQPLASLRRALDPANLANAGFLRPDARLAIVIVSDEDDCSTHDSSMFQPVPDLGPINFRCTIYGVTCDGDPDLRHLGARSNCRPNEASPYMDGVQGTIDLVRGLKTDPSKIFVAGLLGPATPFEIIPDPHPLKPGDPALGSCHSTTGDALPAVRTRALIDAFAGQSATASICDPLSDQFAALGTAIAAPLSNACITSALFDGDQETPGLQASCVVSVAPASGAPFAIPACVTSGTAITPCWTLVEDEYQCGLTAQHLRVRVDWGTEAPKPGTRVRAECDVPAV